MTYRRNPFGALGLIAGRWSPAASHKPDIFEGAYRPSRRESVSGLDAVCPLAELVADTEGQSAVQRGGANLAVARMAVGGSYLPALGPLTLVGAAALARAAGGVTGLHLVW